MKIITVQLAGLFLMFCLVACGRDDVSSQLHAVTPLTIIICKATAKDTKAQFIEHTHLRSSDDKEIDSAKKKTKEQALKICSRYSDQCSASCN